jgi:hypothetical protein
MFERAFSPAAATEHSDSSIEIPALRSIDEPRSLTPTADAPEALWAYA